MSNAMNQLNYRNDLFFKYALSREDEGSVYARNTIIERVTGIRVKESTVLNPNPVSYTHLDVYKRQAQLHMTQLVFFKNLQVNPFFLSFLLSHCILPTFASDFQFHCE